jgi:GH24 family phage-related lysozyme (muramidase)
VRNLLEALKNMDVGLEDEAPYEMEQPTPRNYVTAPEQAPAVDWKTIEQFEGGRAQEGYVPKSGRSGLTVGAGFDVGQRQNLDGLSPEVQSKLQPFVGKQRGQADAALARQGGVNLTPEQEAEVTGFAKKETEQKMKDEWEKISEIPFENLTPAQQTVLASVMHQYGTFRRAPRFSQFAGKGQWDKVVGELRNFGDDYDSRREREADYLKQSLGTPKVAKK